jgi:hypothetical protein
MQHHETYPSSQGFVHLSRRLAPGERVPACPSLVEQLLAASAAVARQEAQEEPMEAHAAERADAGDRDD